MSLLKEGELLDDLQFNGMNIISHPERYRFTSDSVRLANMVKGGAKTSLVDLCSGAGIIPLLIAAKTPIAKLVGIEIQEDLADMATRSVALNKLENRIRIINRNLIDCHNELGIGKYDIVTCNPPYYPINCGAIRENDSVAMARHEVTCDLNSIIMTASKLLKFGGKLYLVHKCDRLAEVFNALNQYNLQPKELITFTPTETKACDTFIVVAKSGAKCGMVVKNVVTIDSEL